MNPRTDWLNDLQKNVSDLIAKSPAADIEKNVRAMMTQAFSRCNVLLRLRRVCKHWKMQQNN